MINFNDHKIKSLIELAVEEDVYTGDITTNSIIRLDANTKAKIITKEKGVVAGLEIARLVFQYFDDLLKWEPKVNDGDTVKKGTVLVKLEGNYRALLTAERTALNFLQRMSGIATRTKRFVKELKGTKTKILDTRKTVPGHRILDKYAVETGGGTNHRFGLYDMVMIKDNHIKIAGGINKAVEQVRKQTGDRFKIEVETSNIDEVKQALETEVDFIMLDNMSIKDMNKAVKLIKGKAKTEASGNIDINKLKKIAECGVDYISVGALTHSMKALDISMKIE